MLDYSSFLLDAPKSIASLLSVTIMEVLLRYRLCSRMSSVASHRWTRAKRTKDPRNVSGPSVSVELEIVLRLTLPHLVSGS